MITDEQYRIIDRWISAVETGKPDGDYGKVTVLNDGPGGVRQITFGKHQTTETGGNLKELVKRIAFAYGNFGKLSSVMEFLNSPYFTQSENKPFFRHLSFIGPKTDKIQDIFFEQKYWFPACRWAEKNGFKSPLAHLVIYDSFIQSGGIFTFLRKRFPEPVPVNGGREYIWLRQYVQTRHQWLKHWGDGESPKSVTLRKTIYRTEGLMTLIEGERMALVTSPNLPIVVNGIKI